MKINYKKIIDIEELSIKEKLALATTLLVLLVVASLLYSNKNQKGNIDKNLLDIEDMIVNSDESYDRAIYWSLNNIINTYFSSYNLELNAYKGNVDYSNIKFKREDYYNVLSDSYKISKKIYMELSKQIIEKFIKKGRYGEYIPNDITIDTVYLLDENLYNKSMYLCQIKVPNKEEYVYIGIELNESIKTFSIFYLE